MLCSLLTFFEAVKQQRSWNLMESFVLKATRWKETLNEIEANFTWFDECFVPEKLSAIKFH